MSLVLQLTNIRMFKLQFVAPEACRNPALAQRSMPAAAGLSVIDSARDQGTANRRREQNHGTWVPKAERERERDRVRTISCMTSLRSYG